MRRAVTTPSWMRWRPSTALHSSVALRRSNDHVLLVSSCRRMALSTKINKDSADARAPRRRKSVLVDGNNALYHFYNPLIAADSDGVHREAVDGLIGLLKRMDKMHAPAHICVVFDSKRKPTTRKLMDPTYKQLRKPTPQSLGPQLASAAAILCDGGVNCIAVPGFEADDVIASYTEAYVADGYDVLIVSNDNDFLQLARGAPSASDAVVDTSQQASEQPLEMDVSNVQADPSTTESLQRGFVELYQPNKRRYVRERHVQSRFGLPHARLVPAFLALVGTRWGKIAKVEHMTDDRAVALLTQYGSLPTLLRHLNDIDDPVLRKSLKHAISSIETSLRIAQLNDQVALPIAIADMVAPALERLLPLSQSVSKTSSKTSSKTTTKMQRGSIKGKLAPSSADSTTVATGSGAIGVMS